MIATTWPQSGATSIGIIINVIYYQEEACSPYVYSPASKSALIYACLWKEVVVKKQFIIIENLSKRKELVSVIDFSILFRFKLPLMILILLFTSIM